MPVNSILPVRRLPEAFSEPGGYLDVGVCPGASARFDYSGVLEESASPRRGGPRQTENAQGQGVLQRPGLQAEIRLPKKARMARASLSPSAVPPTTPITTPTRPEAAHKRSRTTASKYPAFPLSMRVPDFRPRTTACNQEQAVQ